MTEKEFKERKKEIRSLYVEGNAKSGSKLALKLVTDLWQDKSCAFISELYNSDFLVPKEGLWTFEVAYALAEQRLNPEAEKIYEHIVDLQPHNSSALNNLSNLKKQKGGIAAAFDLIERAYQIDPKDEIISRNYESLLAIIRERDQITQIYQNALTRLPKENEFVIEKLKSFLLSAQKDRDFKDNRMPIPRWKLKVMMGTDDQKALSLLDQWLERGYIRRIEERGAYGEHIYELNPLLFHEITKLKPTKINPQWLKGIGQLNAETLESLSYFTIVQSVERSKKSIRSILLRDVNELYLNYIMKNQKTVIILSGSIVEILLIYYCEKKHIKDIEVDPISWTA